MAFFLTISFFSLYFPKEGCEWGIILLRYPKFLDHSELIKYLKVIGGDLFPFNDALDFRCLYC
jgi:hypothetical protein